MAAVRTVHPDYSARLIACSDAWRKLKHALKVETIPDCFHVRQMLVTSGSSRLSGTIFDFPLAGKIVGMAPCFRKELFSSCQNVWCIPDSRSTMARSVRYT